MMTTRIEVKRNNRIASIEVKRHDYPQRTRKHRNGSMTIIPAFFEAYYFWNGIEVAHYNSLDDVLYLNTDYLSMGRGLSYQERMKQAPNPDMWEDLIACLNIDENTKLSGYINV